MNEQFEATLRKYLEKYIEEAREHDDNWETYEEKNVHMIFTDILLAMENGWRP